MGLYLSEYIRPGQDESMSLSYWTIFSFNIYPLNIGAHGLTINGIDDGHCKLVVQDVRHREVDRVSHCFCATPGT